MMFLQLAAGGHLLLFVVRTRRSVFGPPYPERAAVPGDRGDADRGGPDLRLRHPGAAAALGGDRARSGSMPGLDGGDRPRQAALSSRHAADHEAHLRGLAKPIAGDAIGDTR